MFRAFSCICWPSVCIFWEKEPIRSSDHFLIRMLGFVILSCMKRSIPESNIVLSAQVLQEGGPLPGPQKGLLSNTGNELSEETHMLTKQKTLIGKRAPGGEREGQGTQEDSSAMWLAVSGFMVTELISGLSLANHSDSESLLVAHRLLSQDGCQREGFWEVVQHVVSPF